MQGRLVDAVLDREEGLERGDADDHAGGEGVHVRYGLGWGRGSIIFGGRRVVGGALLVRSDL